jgi:hypothetical protein
LKEANDAFNREDYDNAIKHYQELLGSNPNDEYAKKQIEICKRKLVPITLDISLKSLSLESSGGNKIVLVNTNADDGYTVSGDLPEWYTVTQQSDRLTIRYDANLSIEPRKSSFTIRAGDKTETVNIIQAGKIITLSVSTQNLSFDSGAGTKRIDVTTNADGGYQVDNYPSWCAITQESNFFTIVYGRNSSTELRKGFLTIKAGDKTQTVDITQAGKTTILNVSAQGLYFKTKGETKRIMITTNADNYTITNSPFWCTVTKYKDYFDIECTNNRGNPAREGFVTVEAGSKEIQINISQSGVAYSNAGSYESKCFNCPKAKYPWGVSLGVASMVPEDLTDYDDILAGIQVGLHYEPLFKYGFGVHTGLYYEHYKSEYQNDMDEYATEYEEHVLSIPLHLEYRLNFSKYFNLFVYGGGGLNLIQAEILSSTEFGVGLRINHIQLNMGLSLLPNKGYGYNKGMISISYMF